MFSSSNQHASGSDPALVHALERSVGVDLLTMYLDLASTTNVQKPLSKELDSQSLELMHFGQRYVDRYGVSKYRDMLRDKFVVPSAGGDSTNKKGKSRKRQQPAKKVR